MATQQLRPIRLWCCIRKERKGRGGRRNRERERGRWKSPAEVAVKWPAWRCWLNVPSSVTLKTHTQNRGRTLSCRRPEKNRDETHPLCFSTLSTPLTAVFSLSLFRQERESEEYLRTILINHLWVSLCSLDQPNSVKKSFVSRKTIFLLFFHFGDLKIEMMLLDLQQEKSYNANIYLLLYIYYVKNNGHILLFNAFN